jgi:hypothetical protein
VSDRCRFRCGRGANSDLIRLRYLKDGDETVPGLRIGGPNGLRAEGNLQFSDGYSIALKENEVQQLSINAQTSVEDIEWYIEADVLIDDERRTLQIRDEGRNFSTPGGRDYDEYVAGHTAARPELGRTLTEDWGVDNSAIRSPDGSALRWRPLAIPWSDGVYVYKPYQSGSQADDPGGYRQIRRNGVPILGFNMPGETPYYSDVSVQEECGIEGWSGVIRSIMPPRIESRNHGRQVFVHQNQSFVCNGPNLGQRRDSFDEDEPEYFECGGTLCPERELRRESVRREGSSIAFSTLLGSSNDKEDGTLASLLMNEMQDYS